MMTNPSWKTYITSYNVMYHDAGLSDSTIEATLGQEPPQFVGDLWQVVGVTKDGQMFPIELTINTDTVFLGDIVKIENEFYRVYSGAYVNVTAKFQEACRAYYDECVRLEKERVM